MKLYEIGEKGGISVNGESFDFEVIDNWVEFTDHSNSKIFDELCLDMVPFCKKVYGYEPLNSDMLSDPIYTECMPEYREGDMGAASRLIDALKKEASKKNKFRPTFKVDDIVVFRVGDTSYQYRVTNRFLACDTLMNDVIFRKLEILDKELFCTNAYGYASGYGNFPTYKLGDMEAATKIIDALSKKCDEVNSKLEEPKKSAASLYNVGDQVVFDIGGRWLEYRVGYRYIENGGGYSNSEIFSALGVDDKIQFCTNEYGYQAGIGGFPEYKGGDMVAATKVINALFKKCDEFNEGVKEKLTMLLTVDGGVVGRASNDWDKVGENATKDSSAANTTSSDLRNSAGVRALGFNTTTSSMHRLPISWIYESMPDKTENKELAHQEPSIYKTRKTKKYLL